MAVTETLRALGSWGVTFNKKMPDEVWKRLEYFGHICIHVGRNPGPLDDSLLKSARYVGPVRSINDNTESNRSIGGLGMATWLGDPDGKGDIIKDPLTVNDEFHLVIAALLPASGSVTAGSIFNIGENFSSTFQFQNPRDAIDYVCQTVGVDAAWRVNGDGTLDAGLESQIFQTNPKCVVIEKKIARNVAAFEDMFLTGLSGTADTSRDVEDYTTDVLLLAQGINGQFVQAEANTDPGDVPYVDIHGNKVKLERIVSESETDATNAPARAQLQLNRFSGSRDALTLGTSNYDIKGNAQVGDYLWVYDPEMGLIDTANEIPWRGQRINPYKLQLTETTWPITSKMSVFYRAGDGTWTNLTKYVVPETGETTLVVGGYNRSLTSGGSSPFPVSPPPDTSVPDVVTWVTPFRLATYQSIITGEARGEVILAWNQPDNTDTTTIIDGSHYEIRYRRSTTPLYPVTYDMINAAGLTYTQWETSGATYDHPIHYAETEWQTAFAPFDVQVFRLQELVPAMPYEAQIRAVDTATPPNVGAWSAVTNWVTTSDDIPPSTPAAPAIATNPLAVEITHTLGISTGGTFNLERDLHHLELHRAGDKFFTPDDNTLIGRCLANYGMMVAQVPVVQTFQIPETTAGWFKVVAVDEAGNKSGGSAAVQRTADLLNSQHIAELTASKISAGTITSSVLVSGRIATMPSGGFPGVELTSAGLKGWNTSGQNPLRWDSTTGALHVDGNGGIEIQDGRMVIKNGLGQVIVEIGECADGRHGVQVYKDNGTRVARIGELASSVDEGIELLNDVGNLVRLSNVVFGISSDYNVSTANVSGTGAWVDLTGQPNSPTCQAVIGNTGKAIVLVGASLISSNGLYIGMSVRIDGPGGYVRNPDTLDSLAASGPAGAVLHEGSRAFLFDGLPAGTCTFTAKYWSSGGTGQAGVRTIAVLPY